MLYVHKPMSSPKGFLNVFFFSNIGAVIGAPILINRQLIREKKNTINCGV